MLLKPPVNNVQGVNFALGLNIVIPYLDTWNTEPVSGLIINDLHKFDLFLG
jgi:hypothetical protein